MFSVRVSAALVFPIPVFLARTDGGVDSGAGHGQQNEDHGGGAAGERPQSAESRGGDADGDYRRSSAADSSDAEVDADGDTKMKDDWDCNDGGRDELGVTVKVFWKF